MLNFFDDEGHEVFEVPEVHRVNFDEFHCDFADGVAAPVCEVVHDPDDSGLDSDGMIVPSPRLNHCDDCFMRGKAVTELIFGTDEGSIRVDVLNLSRDG